MKNPLRRYAASALAVGAIAGGAALGLPSNAPTWHPVTYGLHETPAQLLPAIVSSAHPVRVVSTALDKSGRPVVTVHTATDTTTAASYVKSGQKAKNAVGVELDATMTATVLPTGTDPLRTQQWDMTKIRVGDAWQKSTGAGVTVAVIDTGVDASHPDLVGQVLSGYDEITKTAGVSADPNGHGTHVSGTIAALTGNGVGVSSVAPNAKILPIRVLGADGSGYMSDAANGIIYAADHGANVINMSLGSSSQVAAVTNAISYARSKGVVVVAAAGNERGQGSPTSYPGADPGVIAVAATDSTDTVASYSNQGSYVDVAAPGSGILSTTGGGYQSWSGTSMASPHVAAVAALLKGYNSALTPDQIEKAIETSAVDLGPAGKDTDYGYGRIDAAAALAAVGSPTTTPTTAPTTTPSSSPVTSAPTSAPATKEPTKAPTTAPTTASPTPTVTKTVTPTPTVTKTTAPVVKIRPVVKVDNTGQLVSYGAGTSTTFTVTGQDKPWAQRPVQVCVVPFGAAAQCTNATTSATGTVTVPRTATAAFQLYLTVPATDTNEAVTSPTAIWTVQATVAVVRTGNTMTVTIGGASGQSVVVQRQDGSRWLAVATGQASAKLTVSSLTTGQHYRVVVADTAALKGATSTTV
jgi:serine protease